jgi:MFS family permease
MQFLFVPMWGRLSDRIGRRPVLLWSALVVALAMVGLGLALGFGQSVVWVFVARIVAGIATATLGTASAYIADVTPPSARAKGMGLIGMAFGLGFILGPGIGGVLADIPFNGRHGPYACFAAAALSVVNVVWIAVGLPESLPPSARSVSTGPRIYPWSTRVWRDALADRGVAVAMLVNFLVLLSFTNLDQTFRYFTKDVFQLSMKGTGLVLAFVGVVAALVQGGAIRPLAARYGEVKLIRVGALLQALAFAGIAASAHEWFDERSGFGVLLAASSVLALGNGLSQPSSSAYISKRAPADKQGAVLGVSQSVGSLARVFGPAMGGSLYMMGRTMPYTVAAVGMLLATLFTFRYPATYSTSTQTS